MNELSRSDLPITTVRKEFSRFIDFTLSRGRYAESSFSDHTQDAHKAFLVVLVCVCVCTVKDGAELLPSAALPCFFFLLFVQRLFHVSSVRAQAVVKAGSTDHGRCPLTQLLWPLINCAAR